MSERSTLGGEDPLLTVESKDSPKYNFWDRIRRVEANLAEIRKMIDELKEASL